MVPRGGEGRVTRLLITWHTLALDAIMHAAAAPLNPPSLALCLFLATSFPSRLPPSVAMQ